MNQIDDHTNDQRNDQPNDQLKDRHEYTPQPFDARGIARRCDPGAIVIDFVVVA